MTTSVQGGLAAEVREGVIAIAREAAAAILAVYDSEFAIQHKEDRSPLTAADLAAHRCILAGLAALTPDIPVLSEESAHEVPTATRRSWSRLWVVDPLDGTREFIKRNGEFTVNIALIEQNEPIFGVVHAPVTGETWHARQGRNAYRRVGQVDTQIRTRSPATGALKVAASRSHRDARTQAFLDALVSGEAVAEHLQPLLTAIHAGQHVHADLVLQQGVQPRRRHARRTGHQQGVATHHEAGADVVAYADVRGKIRGSLLVIPDQCLGRLTDARRANDLVPHDVLWRQA